LAWVSIEIPISGTLAESLGDLLLAAGAVSVSTEAAKGGASGEQPLFAEPHEPRAFWSHCVVKALFPADTDTVSIAAAATQALGITPALEFSTSLVADQDWVKLTQAQFEPIPIPPRLWVVPSWHAPPDPHAINLMLDPGQAFGTGSHATTRLCLQWLDANIRGGETVLDYGCGSGILAIAAMKLGAARAIGVDIDPVAVDVAKRNARENAVGAEFVLPDAALDLQADVSVANILANPLITLAPLLAQLTRRGGRLVLSGILSGQAAEVVAAYDPWFGLSVSAAEDNWVCLAGEKHT